MNKFIKLMVILSTFSLSIDAKLFRVYNLNHKGVKQYLVSAVRRYSTKRDAIKFVWCDMEKKDDIYVFWFTYSSYRHLLDDGKSYGVTYIDSVPMFLESDIRISYRKEISESPSMYFIHINSLF